MVYDDAVALLKAIWRKYDIAMQVRTYLDFDGDEVVTCEISMRGAGDMHRVYEMADVDRCCHQWGVMPLR